MRFDDCTEDMGFGRGVVAIEASKGDKTFPVHLVGSGREGLFVRKQFSLLPERVRTVQTAQGMSMDRVTATLAKGSRISRDEWWMQVYVMLSRARTLKGLLLFSLPKKDFFRAGPPKYVMDGMAKLEMRGRCEMEEAVTRLRDKYGFSTSIRQLAASLVGSPAVGVASEPRGSKRAPQASEKEASEAKRGSASVEVTLSQRPLVPSVSHPPLLGVVQTRIDVPAAKRGLASLETAPQRRLGSSVHVPPLTGGAQSPGQAALSLDQCIPDDEDIGFLLRLALKNGQNVFGVPVPSHGVAELYLTTKHRVASPNLGNTCFVNAALQLLFRLEPLHKALVRHVCASGPEECSLCCVREQCKALRDKSYQLPSGCPLAWLARRGFFGDEFAANTDQAKKKLRTAGAGGVLDKLDVTAADGQLRRRGAQCDAVAFIDALMRRLAIEKHALEGYDPATSRELWYDLFGFVVRSRRRGDYTRDSCEGN